MITAADDDDGSFHVHFILIIIMRRRGIKSCSSPNVTFISRLMLSSLIHGNVQNFKRIFFLNVTVNVTVSSLSIYCGLVVEKVPNHLILIRKSSSLNVGSSYTYVYAFIFTFRHWWQGDLTYS